MFCSYTIGRLQNGVFVNNPVSRYDCIPGIPMQHRANGLPPQEAAQIVATCALL